MFDREFRDSWLCHRHEKEIIDTKGEGNMKRAVLFVSINLVLLFSLCPAVGVAQEEQTEKEKLAVLWTSGDPDVAHRVAFMYTHNAKRAGWFDEVTLIVWGPSQRLLVGDQDLQAEIKKMQDDGVVVEACIACAMSYGIVDQLKALGITVRGMGVPLSDYLKDGWKVLTF
jgi:hypothetical protein